ncbi:hypothetical protein JCM5350_004522 [Sporobolomyces pararoseus]
MITLSLLLLFSPLLSSASSINSHSSTSRVLFDQTPILTFSSTSSRPYICQPITQCIPCLPSEIEGNESSNSQVCSIWGNKRKLSCQLYDPSSSSSNSRLNPLPISDPDAQSNNNSSTITSSTSNTEPSKYYEYEPDRQDENDGAGNIKEIGYESSDELDNVVIAESGSSEDELRQIIEAEKKKQKKRGKDYAKGEFLIRYFSHVEKRALNGGGGEDNRLLETFEACPKVVKREQSDYFEFVLCNLFFALSGLAVLMYRQRTLAGRQFGKLVARIMQTEIR